MHLTIEVTPTGEKPQTIQIEIEQDTAIDLWATVDDDSAYLWRGHAAIKGDALQLIGKDGIDGGRVLVLNPRHPGTLTAHGATLGKLTRWESDAALTAMVETEPPDLLAEFRDLTLTAWRRFEADARREARIRAKERGKPYNVYVLTSGGFAIVCPEDMEDDRYQDYVVTYSTTEDEPPDPLAEFRDLEVGQPLYDRASGRVIGAFEGLTKEDRVQLHSNITTHTAWSSGLALTAIPPS